MGGIKITTDHSVFCNSAGIRLFSYSSRQQQTKVETETGSVQETVMM
ncbi:MAG: hypothetical protein NC124_20005 [Clostridium sp.]|nr:hypothetical protein [Clostridium sp.]